MIFFAKDDRTILPGRQGAPYFGRCGRELVSKTAIFRYRKVGGATVEGLLSSDQKTAPPLGVMQ